LANADYKSIEIATSVRHYLPLNDISKFYINTSILFDLISKSSIIFTRADGRNLNTLEINSRLNLALGIGFKHNEKYSVELRYQTNREILSDYVNWSSNYKTVSFVVGYAIF
jgi:hypothetical protein